MRIYFFPSNYIQMNDFRRKYKTGRLKKRLSLLLEETMQELYTTKDGLLVGDPERTSRFWRMAEHLSDLIGVGALFNEAFPENPVDTGHYSDEFGILCRSLFPHNSVMRTAGLPFSMISQGEECHREGLYIGIPQNLYQTP
jgi:hypothetical protein